MEFINNFNHMGWICPSCQRSHSPSVATCPYCGPVSSSSSSTIPIFLYTSGQLNKKYESKKGSPANYDYPINLKNN